MDVGELEILIERLVHLGELTLPLKDAERLSAALQQLLEAVAERQQTNEVLQDTLRQFA